MEPGNQDGHLWKGGWHILPTETTLYKGIKRMTIKWKKKSNMWRVKKWEPTSEDEELLKLGITI